MLQFFAKRRLNIIDFIAISIGSAINVAGHFWIGMAVVIVGSIVSVEIESHARRATGSEAK